MSYDIYLKDPKTMETIVFDKKHDIRGGTYAIGGTHEAHLNITYNYAPFYYEHIDPKKGIRALYGKTGAEALPIIMSAVCRLGTKKSSNYWDATPGNAGSALQDLAFLCTMALHGIVDGD